MTQNSAKDSAQTAPDSTASASAEASETDFQLSGSDDGLRLDGAEAASGEEGPVEGGDTDTAAVDPAARIAELEAETESLRNDYLRALAEAQNTKRLADKRIQDNTRYAVSNLAKALLTVADNMERAVAAAPEEARAADPHLKNLAVGVEMTAKELMSTLGQYGVAKVEAMNQPFDPNLHQAVQEFEDKTVPAGTVVQVYQAGYVIHDRLLRPAMVVVSRGGPKRTAVEEGGAPNSAEPGVDTSV